MGLMEICTDQANSPLPSDLVMNGGKTATGGDPCTGVYQYTVAANDDFSTVDYEDRV